MHVYSSDNEFRSTFLAFLGVIAFVIADQLNIEVGVLAAIPNQVKNTRDQQEMLDDDEDETAESAVNTQKAEPHSSTSLSQDEGMETEATDSATSSGLPWIYQRSSITDGRAKTVQLHLQQETLGKERDVKTEIESQIGETVNKADLREAAYLVGLAHLKDINDQLSEWGYNAE